jgi:hypothetical protein
MVSALGAAAVIVPEPPKLTVVPLIVIELLASREFGTVAPLLDTTSEPTEYTARSDGCVINKYFSPVPNDTIVPPLEDDKMVVRVNVLVAETYVPIPTSHAEPLVVTTA